MTYEATKIAGETYLNPVQRTVADSGTIEKGTILELADPNTCTANNGAEDVFGGIAAAEKVTLDGSTTISAYMSGVFDMYTASGAISAGMAVSTSGANLIHACAAGQLLTGAVIGYAEEDAVAATIEKIRVRLRGQ